MTADGVAGSGQRVTFCISKTPFRISFFGGGTDYPLWYRREGGAVLSVTIDKYCYISCRWMPPFFAQRHRVVWSHIETVSSISEILHPAVRAGLQMLGFTDQKGIEIHHHSDLPARSGMGSSSAFAVGLLNALHTLRGGTASKRDLYLQAIELEQERLKENVGSQDQVACAVGGLSLIHFDTDGRIRVEPLALAEERQEQLNRKLMLFYTGTSRLATEVAAKVIACLDSREEALRQMRRLVDEAAGLLRSGAPLDLFGKMLHETWLLKRSLSSVISNDRIDEIYTTAHAAGALGGKLLGAGASGFMLFYAPESRQPAVRQALQGLLEVPLHFESEGSAIIHWPETRQTRPLVALA